MKESHVYSIWPAGAVGRAKCLTLVALLVVLSLAMLSSPAAAQQPPLPTNRYVSQFPVTAAPSQYEVVQLMLDFAPGASTLLHSHGGPTYVTVLEGQITRAEDGKDSSYSAGQTFIEPRGQFHSASNRGSARARVIASLLLSPGQSVTINHPDSPTPAALPTTTFISRTTLGVQPAEFTLTQVVVEFGQGAYIPLHTHGGPGIVTVSQGEIAFGTASGSERKQLGGVFLDVDAPHDARNVGAGPATAIVTFLIRRGAAITSFVTPPTTIGASLTVPAAPAGGSPVSIAPPRTGDAGEIQHSSLSSASFVEVLGLSVVSAVVFVLAGGIAFSWRKRLSRSS